VYAVQQYRGLLLRRRAAPARQNVGFIQRLSTPSRPASAYSAANPSSHRWSETMGPLIASMPAVITPKPHQAWPKVGATREHERYHLQRLFKALTEIAKSTCLHGQRAKFAKQLGAGSSVTGRFSHVTITPTTASRAETGEVLGIMSAKALPRQWRQYRRSTAAVGQCSPGAIRYFSSDERSVCAILMGGGGRMSCSMICCGVSFPNAEMIGGEQDLAGEATVVEACRERRSWV
jgi:methylphosphotriester-DNA--protein-cysteine methyltransferase